MHLPTVFTVLALTIVTAQAQEATATPSPSPASTGGNVTAAVAETVTEATAVEGNTTVTQAAEQVVEQVTATEGNTTVTETAEEVVDEVTTTTGNTTVTETTEQVVEEVTTTTGNATTEVSETVAESVTESVTTTGNATAAGNSTTEDVIPLPDESAPAETPIVSEGELSTDGDAAFLDPATAPTEDLAVNPDLPPAPTGPTSSELSRNQRVRYQEVRTQAEKDPAVLAMREKAAKARTFEDERAALREYYRLLFARMRKIDKSLSARCNVMERAYIARLAQSRLEPTIPLNPPPTPEPLAD